MSLDRYKRWSLVKIFECHLIFCTHPLIQVFFRSIDSPKTKQQAQITELLNERLVSIALEMWLTNGKSVTLQFQKIKSDATLHCDASFKEVRLLSDWFNNGGQLWTWKCCLVQGWRRSSLAEHCRWKKWTIYKASRQCYSSVCDCSAEEFVYLGRHIKCHPFQT